MDSLLSQHRGLLSPAEEGEYVNLLVAAREEPADEEGNAPALPLRLAILHLKLQLLVRDSSEEVNSFTIGGQSLWFSPALRANLRNAIDALEAASEQTVSFHGITLPIADAKAALTAIELYAAKCSNVTEQHKANIEELGSIADVNRYDITVGYPAKLVF